MFRYAQRVVGRRDVAEELTSDAFISLWKIFDTIDTSQLPGWLFTAVRNRAIDYWRRAGEALAGARWYADPHGDAWKALKFEGALAVAGMDGGRIEWKLDGVIMDPEVLLPAVDKWLKGER